MRTRIGRAFTAVHVGCDPKESWKKSVKEEAMGGAWSTRWRGHTKAQTVERSFILSIKMLREAGVLAAPYRAWRATWTRFIADRVIEQVDIAVHATLPLVVDLDRHRLEVEMEERTFRYGGRSWWLLCPRCGRRCLKLYLPPGAAAHPTPFRCRRCWGLVYEASQVVHKWDRGFLASPAMARVIRVERALAVLARPATRKKRARALHTLFTVKI